MFSHLTNGLVILAGATDFFETFSILETGAVLQAASGNTVDSMLEAVAALYEVSGTLAAAPVLSGGLDNVADFVVEVVLEMVALGVEEDAVHLEVVAVHSLAVCLNLLVAVVQL